MPTLLVGTASGPFSRYPLIAVLLGAFVVVTRATHAQAGVADSSAVRAVATAFAYTGEIVANASGGRTRGAAYAGAGAAQITLLLEPLLGWRGARAFLSVLGTHGRTPDRLVGDVQGVSNIAATASVRLEEAWLQQNLLANRLSLLVGRYDLNSEFYRLQSAALFVNSSFGIGPELAQSGAGGPSIFPRTSVGARIDFKPAPNAVWRLAVLDGAPVDRSGHSTKIFAPGDGALVVGEMALLSRPDTAVPMRGQRFQIGRGLTRTYAAKVAIGAWYYTSTFPDLVDTLSNGTSQPHRGSFGAYVLGDKTLWARSQTDPRSLSAFVQLGLGDGRVNQIAGYAAGGLTLAAPIVSRDQDLLGVAVASALNGTHFGRAQSAMGIPAAGETTLELTYSAQLRPWLSVQPDAQLVIHPGGTRALRNAIVPGLRIAISH
jgi:porin